MNSSEKILTLTDGNLGETVKRSDFVVVDCFATWCIPCKLIEPIIDELSHEYDGKVTFAKLNVDENPKIAMEFAIMSIPTILFFKKGLLVDKLIGAVPKAQILERLEKNLKHS
ncbi:MAG: thioredoxin [Candidatus Methanofastidiosia archaeon]